MTGESLWVVIVRNDAWDFPDVFGPFYTEADASDWAEEHIDFDVTDPLDVKTQRILDRSDDSEPGYGK